MKFPSACGVIGSRARLRIWWGDPWGFESLHAHATDKAEAVQLQLIL